jgi:hypothetical protein
VGLVAGEETKESLSTWPRAEAAQQSSGSERVARETEGGGKKESERKAADGRGSRRREKKNARASCEPFFSFFDFCFLFFLIFLSLPFNFLLLLISYVYSLYWTLLASKAFVLNKASAPAQILKQSIELIIFFLLLIIFYILGYTWT